MISPKRLLPLLALVAATAGAAACNDSTGFEATIPTVNDTLEVYALTGAPREAPTAYDATFRRVTRVDSLSFDVAFDLASGGASVVLYPLNTLGSSTAARSVGIRIDSTRTFEQVTRAPGGVYVVDSVLTLPVGRTAILRTPGSTCTIYSLSQYVYTKLVVDSVRASQGRIFFRTTHDPNCGFRSFKPGIPKE